MAGLIKFQGDSDVYVNVSHHVGSVPYGNQRQDIVLVQALLNIIYGASSGKFASPLGRLLTVTGKPDADTLACIEHYQRVFQGRNRSVDKVVSPARADRDEFAATKIWTIIHLNNRAELTLIATRSGEDLIPFLRKSHPGELDKPLDGDIVVVPQ